MSIKLGDFIVFRLVFFIRVVIINLGNYINLSCTRLNSRVFKGYAKEFSIVNRIDSGAGMHGLPGDNTPPSQFVRAVDWSPIARTVSTSQEIHKYV